MNNAKAIALIDTWLEDESGYDAVAYQKIEERSNMESKTKIESPFVAIIKAVRAKEGSKRKVQGVVHCAKCKADFHYAIASNGHIAGKCSGCGIGFTM